jgi:hypothetical protein
MIHSERNENGLEIIIFKSWQIARLLNHLTIQHSRLDIVGYGAVASASTCLLWAALSHQFKTVVNRAEVAIPEICP